MEKEVSMMNSDLPQLRQMVLDNTQRISRNEMMIDKLCMENAEASKERKERDEWLKNFRNESDESMRKSRERMDRLERFAEISRMEHEKRKREWDKQFEQLCEQMKETDRQMKETDRHLKERDERFDREMKERREEFAKELKEGQEKFDREMKESREKFDREMKESREKFDREMKESRNETNAAIRRISVEFLGATGHIVEGLASSAVDKIFNEAGLNLLHYGKNIKPMHPEANGKAEIDVLLGNEKFNVPVEVKADFTKKKVKRFVSRMEQFRVLFPEYSDKDVIAAVAAINYEDGADKLARDEGLLVIRVSSDDIFSLDPFDVKTLRRF